LLGVCLKQPLTKQAIKTFTEHCACLSNFFAEKLQKLRKAKARKSTGFSYLYQLTALMSIKIWQGYEFFMGPLKCITSVFTKCYKYSSL
jgi:hypothetical protein